MMHTLLQCARDRKTRLIDAPYQEQKTSAGDEQRVLDLGCGTGIWCLDMAATFKNTNFIGVDLYNLGPKDLLQNVDLRAPFDYENPWAIGEQSWDLIHLQMGLGSVMDWPNLYRKIVRHLKPGGWFENVEIDWQPRCDDGTLPANGRLRDWWENRIAPAYEAVSRRIAYREDTGTELAKAGFTNIQHRVYRIPLNGWSSDRAENRSGTWWGLAMSSGQDLGCGLEALSLAILTRMHGWPEAHARRFCEEVAIEAANPNIHAYNNLHVWWACAPGATR